MVATVRRQQKAPPPSDLKGENRPDPRTVPGAFVKTPGGLRAYVEGVDPKDAGRVLISYESKSLGSDSYQPSNLTLVQPSPDQPTAAQAEVVSESKPDAEQVLEAPRRRRTTPDLQLKTQNLDPLADLATQLSQIYSDYEAAEDVAKQAGQSALQHAYQCGQILLKAKEAVGHGGWEQWREANIISQRTGKPMPSSTATLFQRVYKHWEDISKSTTVADLTLREAIALLPKKTKPPMPPRETPDAYDYTPLPEVKPVWFKVGDTWTEGQAIAANGRSMTRIVWGENRESDIPDQQVRWSKPVELPDAEDVLTTQITPEVKAGLTAAGLAICKPSITPEEFNREMWKGDPPAAVSYTPTASPPVACQLCQHRTRVNHTEYCCEMDEFEDVMPLKYDWAKDGFDGICKSFNASPHPLYEQALECERQAQMEPESPTVRLKVKRGRGNGVEILSAIVQIGGITHYLQVSDLTLEDV